jgi:hypothetical protein
MAEIQWRSPKELVEITSENDLRYVREICLDLMDAWKRIAELETHERQRIAQLEEQYRIHTANTREWKEALDKQTTRIAELETVLAEARKDTERLDWLSQWKEGKRHWSIDTKKAPLTIWIQSGCWSWGDEQASKSLREVIDAAKEKSNG